MFESGEEVTREGSLAFLERGCSDVQRAIVKQGIHTLVSFNDMEYDKHDSVYFDLKRFCIDAAGQYNGMSVKKTLAGLVVGVEVSLAAGVLLSELKTELQAMTIYDYSINDRVAKFELLASNEVIEPLEDCIPMPDDLLLHGKNYFMGVRAVLSAGFAILNTPYTEMQVALEEEWFEQALATFSDPETPLFVPDY